MTSKNVKTTIRKTGQTMTKRATLVAKARFMEHFKEDISVTRAMDAAGVSHSTLHRWKLTDPEFLEKFTEIWERGNDAIRTEIWQRAIDGYDKPIVSAGRLVATVRERSDLLLMFLAKSRMPEFRENSTVALTGASGGPVEYQEARSRVVERIGSMAENLRRLAESPDLAPAALNPGSVYDDREPEPWNEGPDVVDADSVVVPPPHHGTEDP